MGRGAVGVGDAVGPARPEIVFRPERLHVRGDGVEPRLLFQHPQHAVEQRDLRPAVVVRPVPEGDEPEAVQKRRDVPDHPVDQIGPPGRRQPLRGEVAVPVVHLAEAAAGHDVRVREGDDRRPRGVGGVEGPRQRPPQRGHVVLHRPRRGEVGRGPDRLGQPEVVLDERRQIEVPLAPFRQVPFEEQVRVDARFGVDEPLVVLEEVPPLDGPKEFAGDLRKMTVVEETGTHLQHVVKGSLSNY
ncbi:hypothetical protein BN903_112 [Halorubrum sp. AJ67]|nr:hypothetical protein BN903_112 [Halorubrum sp. AJ67]